MLIHLAASETFCCSKLFNDNEFVCGPLNSSIYKSDVVELEEIF